MSLPSRITGFPFSLSSLRKLEASAQLGRASVGGVCTSTVIDQEREGTRGGENVRQRERRVPSPAGAAVVPRWYKGAGGEPVGAEGTAEGAPLRRSLHCACKIGRPFHVERYRYRPC